MSIKQELFSFLHNAVEKFENKEESYQSILIDGLFVSSLFEDGKLEITIKDYDSMQEVLYANNHKA